MNAAERAERKNAELNRRMVESRDEHGYLAVHIGRGAAVHAARSIIRGHEGFNHPRPLCQGHSRTFYAGAFESHRDVTCQRCIASLATRQKGA